MKQVVIEEFNALAQTRYNIDLPIGKYDRLIVYMTGTSDTGDQIELAEIGTIRITRNGRQIQLATAEFYYYYTHLKRGFPTLTQASAGTNVVAFMVPFMAPGLPNVLDVKSKEEVDVTFEFLAALDTAMVTCTITVVGILAPALTELYELQISDHNMQAAAAARKTEILTGPNIAAIYARDAAAKVTAITLQRDGDVVVDNINDAVVLAISRMENQIESAADGSFFEIALASSGILQETVNNTIKADVQFSASGTLEIYLMRVSFNPVNVAASAEAAAAYLAGLRSPDQPVYA